MLSVTDLLIKLYKGQNHVTFENYKNLIEIIRLIVDNEKKAVKKLQEIMHQIDQRHKTKKDINDAIEVARKFAKIAECFKNVVEDIVQFATNIFYAEGASQTFEKSPYRG